MIKNIYFILFPFVLILIPFYAEAEFYQYVDQKGVKHFTDNKGTIPDSSFNNIVEHKDKYDYMTEDEKKVAKTKDREKAEELNKKRQLELQKYREKATLLENAEKLKKKLQALRTSVIISNNQILVPVTLTYNNNIVTTTLLLDTGANSTVINDSVAAQLNINSGEKNLARVAGGTMVETKLVKMDSIQVGPKVLTKNSILVLKHQGRKERFQGLLGLDFLRNFNHTIDYENNYIYWKD